VIDQALDLVSESYSTLTTDLSGIDQVRAI